MFNNANYTQLNNSSIAFSTRTGNIYHNVGGSRSVIWWILWWLFLLTLPCAYVISNYHNWIYEDQRVAFSAPTESATASSSHQRESPDILYGRVAMTAALNTGGRVDDAKCHPGTREAVIGLIEQWSETFNGTSKLLWLSGPAGGGKTAIMKTIAERSKDRSVHTVNFFFFRADPARNSVHPLVATLLYQIFQLYPATYDVVADILSSHPLLLDTSIQEQFKKLIHPLSDIIQKSSPERTQVVLLIDGLDECYLDAKRSQEEVLHALDDLITRNNSPFLALVASRPDSHIQMVFNELASKAQHIFLDGRYSPEKDIRHFVATEFDRIKAAHPQAHLLPKDWPSEPAIDAIVAKSSNQFIYAAAVMRYLANPSTVPSLSLERAQGPVLYYQKSPFPQLDDMYTYILQQAEDQQAIRDITFFILVTYYAHWLEPLSCAARILPEYHQTNDQAESLITNLLGVYDSRYTPTLVESSLSDLAAIVQYQDNKLVFYHADMTDFFVYGARSGSYRIPGEYMFENVLQALLKRSLGKSSPGDDVLLNQMLETRIRNCGIWIASTEVYYGAKQMDPAYHTSCGRIGGEFWNCVYHTHAG